MKRNGKKITIIIFLAIIAVGTYTISGTYARYSKGFGGESKSASVAKFSVSATNLNTAQNAEINLFSTIKEEDTTSQEDHVAADKIAPGTGGQFTTKLTNNSEVDVTAEISISETNINNIPIEYSFDKSDWFSASESNTNKGNFTLNYKDKTGGTSEKDVFVYWRWKYNSTDNDAKDNELGSMETAPTVKTKVTVTFTQVD